MLLVLPMDGQFRNTYISENALLPAQAHTYFRESEWNLVRGYREEVHLLENKTEQERTQTLRGWFDDIGLKTSFHDWNVSYGDEINNGTNVYGIMHAPRGENTEAMVVVAPWINKDGDFNDGGVALVVSLARYLSRWSLWSKNIIFVVTSDSYISLRSWVTDYHTSMANTAGAIEAAIVLDFPDKSDHFSEIEISYEGLNGQLPNLDLVNTAVLISHHEYVNVIIQNMGTINFTHYKTRALTFFRGIISQLTAGLGPGPGSEAFSGWRIHAITLKARGVEGSADITTFGRVVESLLRSVNNLLEHFHQSFFFYFLLSPRNFVSIGTYLPAAILLAIAYPLMAIYNVVAIPVSASIPNSGVSSGSHHTRTISKLSDIWKHATPVQLSVIAPILLLSSVYGISFFVAYVSLHVLPTWFVTIFTQALHYVHIIITVFVIGQQLSKYRKSNQETIVDKINKFYIPKVPRCVVSFAQAYAMVLHGLVLTTLAMLNFSLAIVVGAATLPLMYIVPNSFGRSAILLFISSPTVWLSVILRLSESSSNSIKEITKDLLWSWRGLGVWTWLIIICVWLPFWVIGLAVATLSSNPSQEQILQVEKEKAKKQE